MNYINTKFLLNERPKGMPSDSCWVLKTENITGINQKIVSVECMDIMVTFQ